MSRCGGLQVARARASVVVGNSPAQYQQWTNESREVSGAAGASTDIYFYDAGR